MLELGGFNEKLYPNEENALMDDIQNSGGRLLYDPELFVHRRPRSTLKSFVKMLMTYGRGRAEQFRLNPTFGSALNFVPPLFCVYLLALIILELLPLENHPLKFFAAMPLAVYFVAIILQTLALMPAGGIVRSLAGDAVTCGQPYFLRPRFLARAVHQIKSAEREQFCR